MSLSNNSALHSEFLSPKWPKYPLGVHVPAQKLDEKVARLHLDALGAELTELTPEQAKYIGVEVEGHTNSITIGTETKSFRPVSHLAR